MVVSQWILSCKKYKTPEDEKQIFRYNESSNIQTLDPAFAKNQAIIWPCNQLFNGLVQLDDRLEIQPDIAQRWNISENGKVYQFHLRKDVYFHEHENFGKPKTRTVKASDFVYSFKRILNPKIASSGAWIFQNVENFIALNDSVLEIHLKKPSSVFLGLLTMKYASVVPKEICEDSKIEFRKKPIGTGPFQFKFWEENIKLVLRKNPLYFERDSKGKSLPYLKAISITFLPEKQSTYLQFIQGKLDFISGLDASYKSDILTPKGTLQPKHSKNIFMQQGPYLNLEYIGFRLDGTNKAVKDIRIREALNIGFDRKKMIAYLRNGMGEAEVNGVIPKGLNTENTLGIIKFNPEKAKQLVSDYKKEKGDAKLVFSTNSSYADFAEYLQQQWQKIGLDVQIDITPPSILRQSIATGKVSFFRGSWIADYPDAENYLAIFNSKNFAPAGINSTHFKNQTFDTLYQKANQTTYLSKRKFIYNQMNEILNKEIPVIVLFYDKTIHFIRNDVKGINLHPMNLIRLKEVYKE